MSVGETTQAELWMKSGRSIWIPDLTIIQALVVLNAAAMRADAIVLGCSKEV